MGADLVTYHARFKDEQKRYEGIREELITRFIELQLEPDEFPINWENHFQIEDDYMELYIDNCFGNWGHVFDYIEKDFIENHKDVSTEFAIVEYLDGANAVGIIYDGNKIVHGIPDFVEVVDESFEDESFECTYSNEELLDEDEECVDDDWCKLEFDLIDSLTIKGNTFVLNELESIDENKITEIIIRGGGEIQSYPKSNTTYLIVDEELVDEEFLFLDDKIMRAFELKEEGKPISIISVKRFYELCENINWEFNNSNIRRDENGKIVIDNMSLYKEDVKRYGVKQTYEWLKWGKYSLTPEQQKHSK